jgi:uncharacterized C2H2 Zn-finger protein
MRFTCEKCGYSTDHKGDFNKHINKKKPCKKILIDVEITIDNTINNENPTYTCKICNKVFKRNTNYINHINKTDSCNNNIVQELKKYKDLYTELIKENKKLTNENTYLQKENNKINELYNNLLDKCIATNNTINNTNINNNTINNNTINITLKNFGSENCTKLTNDEQSKILKSNKQCISNLIKYLHINDRLPEYKNICIKNLRGKGGYLYEGNKWLHCNFENLLMILFKNKMNDLEKILNSNDELNEYYVNNIKYMIDTYEDDTDMFIKNNKDNIINMLYNNTKNYKI